MRPQEQSNTDQVENWQVLKNLIPYLSEFKGRVFAAIFFLIAAKLANIGLPFVIKDVVNQLSGSIETDSASPLLSVLGNDFSQSWLLAPFGLIVIYGSLRFMGVIFGEIRDTLFGRVTERAMRRIGQRVFIHLHKLDLDFHLNRKTGGLSRDIERGTSGISFLMRFMIFNIVPTLFEIIMVIGILFISYGVEFAVVTLSAIAVYITFSVKVTEWRNGFLRAANKADSDSSTQAIDSLLNYETVKYYTNEDFEAERYDGNLILWEQARRKNRLSLFALNGGQALIIAAAMTSMMLLAGKGVQDGVMTIGDFVLINAFMMQIFMPLNFLGFVYREIKMSLINIEQMFKLLSIEPKIKDRTNAVPLVITDGEISFEQIGFSYQSERSILENISFNISSGQTIAVVGASGSGKSTL
ncbi:MAG: ABC transporter ATP-binding protein/permease, partial [Kangiellaceae bacterium]|nr:ABC transporter ATP-binding protein/permease [Kangiellaceae bacterium]